MKAMIWTRYGPPEVLQLREVEKPVPKDDEVLIRVRATTVTMGDCEARSLRFPFWVGLPMRLYAGFRKPTRITILGQELAGEIEAVGKDVRRFKAGDAVFAATGFRMGAYAEYICMPEQPDEVEGVLARKPAKMGYAEAAAVPVGGLNARFFLRQANLRSGERILINGAGGSIGTFAVQLAKHSGAEVTAVDSGEKLEMLGAIGADRVIDYTREDFTQRGETYDVIFDVVGKAPFAGSMRALNPNGRYLSANPTPSQMVRGFWTTRTSDKTVFAGAAGMTGEDLAALGELIEAGVIRPVIDRTYPLEEAAEAHRYVETGRKQGGVVINID